MLGKLPSQAPKGPWVRARTLSAIVQERTPRHFGLLKTTYVRGRRGPLRLHRTSIVTGLRWLEKEYII